MLRNPVSVAPLSPHSLSCDADDEDVTEMSGGATAARRLERGVGAVNNHTEQDDEQPLDMSCKGVNGRKRSCGEVDGASLSGGGGGDQEGGKRRKVAAAAAAAEVPALVVGNKRKLLRKRRRNKRGGGASGEIVRASVISFAPGSLGSGGGYTSSSSSGGDEEEERRRARLSRGLKRKRIETCHADVEEHFRRSLGGIYDRITAESVKRDVVVVTSGPQAERNSSSRRSSADGVGSVVVAADETNHKNITPKLLFEESIRPSDVDDHFAKALGSETWSKIVNNARAVSAGPSPSSTPIPLSATPPLPPDDLGPQPTTQPPPPPQKAPVSKTSSSSSYKIESILGTSSNNASRDGGGAKSERGASPERSVDDGAVISSSWDRVVLKQSSAST